MLRFVSAGIFLFSTGYGDIYMMNPKGSNNRLNEKSANRNNGNRLFDSQNNNRGGYNAGDLDDTNGFSQNTPEGTAQQMYSPTANLANRQYNMVYTEGSVMRMTWTAQHGCGNAMNNCNFVIQFGCDTEDIKNGNNDRNFNSIGSRRGTGTRMMLRNGGNTQTPNQANNMNNVAGTFNGNNGNKRGRHESEEFYTLCRKRERNKGLFTADQKLKGNAQRFTRQNPNGNRNGLECPEERDYYPWEYPTPWRDVAWIGHDVEYCKTNIAPNSQNVKAKGTCAGPNGENDLPDDDQAEAKTPAECTAAGGSWQTVSWDTGMTAAERAAFPDALCKKQNWSQVNMHGNVDGTTKGGQMDSYEWLIPDFAKLQTQWGCHTYTETIDGVAQQYIRGAMRLRYNISTADYDPYTTDAKFNNDPKNGVISPVQQNPTVDVGAHMQGLRLALNTAQTGRTFQDRSHVFSVMKKVTGTPAAAAKVGNVLNVNVRGKRGNIVQTYPAVEYDFEPNDFVLEQGQCVHFQWTGSNTHNNQNPAGDGQAGDAGEGRGGSDRSNIVEVTDLKTSYPMNYAATTESFFDKVACHRPMAPNTNLTPTDVKAILGTAGYYSTAQNKAYNNNDVNPLLNNVSGSFKQGLVCCANNQTPVKDYYFISTRNNNFSNRSQKMKIKVVAPTAQNKFNFFPPEPTA